MNNRMLRQAAIYALIAAVVLLYVAAISGAFGSLGQSLDDRGSPTAAPTASPSTYVFTRLLIAGIVIVLWIACDLLEMRFLTKIDVVARNLIRGVTGWAFFLALGAAIAPGNHRLLAGGIVLVATALFLGLWLVMLRARRHATQ